MNISPLVGILPSQLILETDSSDESDSTSERNSVSISPRNSFDNLLDVKDCLLDDQWLGMTLLSKMKGGAISLHAVLKQDIDKYCEAKPLMGLAFIKFVGGKSLSIEPWMLPKIFSVLKRPILSIRKLL